MMMSALRMMHYDIQPMHWCRRDLMESSQNFQQNLVIFGLAWQLTGFIHLGC
jgi:hypothetical protein